MATVADLSHDLVEEILSRVPIFAFGAVRSTCKQWNALSENQSFRKYLCGKAAKESLVVMNDNSRVCLMSVKLLHGINNYSGCLSRYGDDCKSKIVEYEIFNFYSKFSSDFGVMNANWYIPHCRQGLSLKGDTYFVARTRLEAEGEEVTDFLLCFDYTRESFGPRLDLPFHSCPSDSVILSSVREEQLAVLLMHGDTYVMEIWITTKIEANALSWSNFLRVDMTPSSGRYQFKCGSFFVVDEKNKVAMVYDKDRVKMYDYASYMIREGGYSYYKELGLGESKCLPFACSYVPSSVQIQKFD
ncbi:unnamed protein product [Microthlaspi erraticum]|uniref:F-box domain-containing protein n=1 Tax=Microthlaspi erraticum TaxID=1685480 RepID=A0A6D2JIB7_9BRAS|nr:unnamed protein product [Microthlaspi erraticum]